MTVLQELRQIAKTAPGDRAIVDESGMWSYKEYLDSAENIAKALFAIGMGIGSRVALLMTNKKEAAACQVGIGAIGSLCILLNTRYKASEIERILNDSKASALIMQSNFRKINYLDNYKDVLSRNRYLKHVIVFPESHSVNGYLGYEEFLKLAQKINDQDFIKRIDKVNDRNPCLVIYTSGTTGEPKGVVLTHRNLISSGMAWKRNLELDRGVNASLFTPMFHAGGAVNGVVGGIVSGCCMVAMETFEAEASLRTIKEAGVQVYLGVPTMLALQMELPEFAKGKLPSLERIVTGGSRVDPDLVISVRERLGCTLQIVYGLSEANITTMTTKTDPESKQNQTIGRPCLDYRVAILDGEGRKTAGEDVGEIAIKGSHVFCDYLDRPKETKKAFAADGWFLSGDLGLMDKEGYIYYVDRRKDMYIRGGVNIYPGEIENVLQNCPGVMYAAVIPVSHQVLGEVGKAYIVRKEESNIGEKDIITYLKKHLANYKLPDSIVFRDNLPMTPFGKIQKSELKKEIS